MGTGFKSSPLRPSLPPSFPCLALQLGEFRKAYPHIPIIALTATATDEVLEDVYNVLHLHTHGFNKCLLFKQPPLRPNLFFEIRGKEKDKENAKQDVLELLQDPASGCGRGTGIVYCMTQKDTEALADFLFDAGESADHYHAGRWGGEVREGGREGLYLYK